MTNTETIKGRQVVEGMHVEAIAARRSGTSAPRPDFFIATTVRRFGEIIRIEERDSSGYVHHSLSVRPDSDVTIRKF